VLNIQLALRTVPQFCENISLAVCFGSDGSSYTTSTQSSPCGDAGGAKEIKNMAQQ